MYRAEAFASVIENILRCVLLRGRQRVSVASVMARGKRQ